MIKLPRALDRRSRFREIITFDVVGDQLRAGGECPSTELLTGLLPHTSVAPEKFCSKRNAVK